MSSEEKKELQKMLKQYEHSKLILITEPPHSYWWPIFFLNVARSCVYYENYCEQVIILFVAWAFSTFLRIKKTMIEIDEIIHDTTLLQDNLRSMVGPQTDLKTGHNRERLISVALARKSKESFGKSVISNEIKSLNHQSLKKLYAMYETHMGAVVTKSMKKTLCYHIHKPGSTVSSYKL